MRAQRLAPPAEDEDEDEVYVPPKTAWDLLKFIEATPEELAAKTVGCVTCPVVMLCQVAAGGTGIVCRNCRATSVWCVDEDDPEHVLVLDCQKHRFAENVREQDQQIECALCSGTAMKAAILGVPVTQHYVHTQHAAFSSESRQRSLKEAHTKWLADPSTQRQLSRQKKST